MRCLLVCLLLFAFCLLGFAQDKPQPDRWRGLVLNETTPAQAIEKLGKPGEDKTDRLRIFDLPKQWISKRVEQKTFRLLTWKRLDGVDEAKAGFDGEKLVFVEIMPKEAPAAAALGGIYGIELTPRVSGFAEGAFPADYERNQGRVYPKSYPTVFTLIGVTPQTFLGAMAANVGFGAALRGSLGARDTEIPGKVKRVQLVSRTLENRDGADVLK